MSDAAYEPGTVREALVEAHDKWLETGEHVTIDFWNPATQEFVHVPWDQVQRIWKHIGIE